MKDCDHVHDSLEQSLTCAARTWMADKAGRQSPVAAVIVGDEERAVSLFSNTAGVAQILLTICEFTAQSPRPTDCATCAQAHDRILQALAILRDVPSVC
jgi:hypothetical protein